MLAPIAISPSPLVGGEFAEEWNIDVGLAMNMTPMNDTRVLSFSTLVKGCLRRKEQTQHESPGARKVMTVASAKGRYSRESDQESESMQPLPVRRETAYNTADAVSYMI